MFRTVTFLPESWEDQGEAQEWFRQFDSPPPFIRNMNAARDRTDVSYYRPRPELGNTADDPRVPAGEAGFIREVRLFIQPGAGRQVAELMQKVAALYEEHDIQDRRIVWSQVAGSDGPRMSLFMPARDAADFYAQNSKNFQTIGDDLPTIIGQINRLCRRVEQLNWRTLPELGYQPAN